MADSTEYVNYPVFNTYETDISNNGFNLREQMETAFKALAGLNNGDGWKGPQYDEVVKSYNSVKGNLDQICKDITENIPKGMHAAADRWASTQGKTAEEGNIKSVAEITAPKASGEQPVTWNKAAVDSVKEAIDAAFEVAKKQIEAANDTFITGLASDWKGEDYDTNKATVAKYLDDVKIDIAKMQQEFIKQMEAVQNANASAQSDASSAITYK